MIISNAIQIQGNAFLNSNNLELLKHFELTLNYLK